MYKFDFREILNFEDYNTKELKELLLFLDERSIPYIFIKDDLIERVISIKEFKETFKFIECEIEKHTEYVISIKDKLIKEYL